MKAIALEPQHGWAIARRIRQLSNDVLQVQQGSLYPAPRLEHQAWIAATWGVSEQNRRAKYYDGLLRRRNYARDHVVGRHLPITCHGESRAERK